MSPRLFHIYGPLWVNSYGTMIALGMLVFLYLTYHHPLRKKYIESEIFFNGVFTCLATGLLGGRLLFVLLNFPSYENNWVEIFYPWSGGFALLGGFIVVPPTLVWYLRRHNVSVLPIMDLAALYAPLLQAISRIGCFLAGCCYGVIAPEGFSCAVTYVHPDSLAPLGIPLHPAQLYSMAASFTIFVIIQVFYRSAQPIFGRACFLFLMLEGGARALVEMWRGDGDQYTEQGLLIGQLNAYQGIALAMALIGVVGFWWLSVRKQD